MSGSYWAVLLGAKVYELSGRYRTRVLDVGNGPALVLLHGGGGHLENWARNIPRLAENFRVIAIDLLWHGRSQTSAYDPEIIPPMVDQVVDLLDQLGISHAAVEGQSLGGWVAMRLALQHPARVSHLILTTPMGFEPAGHLDGYERPDWSTNLASSLEMLEDPTPGRVRARMERILAEPMRLTDEAVQVRCAIYADRDLQVVQRRFITDYLAGSHIRRHEVTDIEAAKIVHPTLVYWGDANRTPPLLGEHLARSVHDGRFYCATDTGHWAQYESAPEHDEVVGAFINRTVGAQEALG